MDVNFLILAAALVLVYGAVSGIASRSIVTPPIGEVPAESLADHDAQHGNILGIRRHGVGRNLPAALSQLVGEIEHGVA